MNSIISSPEIMWTSQRIVYVAPEGVNSGEVNEIGHVTGKLTPGLAQVTLGNLGT